MDPLLQQVLEAATRAIVWARQAYLSNVYGFLGMAEEDVQSDAQYLAVLVRRGGCCCGLPTCGARHRLPEPGPAPGSPQVAEAVRTALLGPWHGAELQTGSLQQGMLYSLVLTRQYGMLIGPVEFRTCPACADVCYEGGSCPNCRRGFDPRSGRAFGRDRLFLTGRYTPLARWRCPVGEGQQEHYYPQHHCRGGGGHGPLGQHDHCPWGGCPGESPRHPQRGSALWARLAHPAAPAEGQEADGPEGADLEEALLAGTGAWWAGLAPGRREGLTARVLASRGETAASAQGGQGGVEVEDVAGWLLWGPGELTEAERGAWQQGVAEALVSFNLVQSAGEVGP